MDHPICELTDGEIEWVFGGVAPATHAFIVGDGQHIAAHFLAELLTQSLWEAPASAGR